jgi:hypothetical protein
VFEHRTHRYQARCHWQGSTGCQVDVPADRAAELFALNLSVWRSDPAVDETTDTLDRLAAHLDELRKTSTSEQVRWHLRQLALGTAGHYTIR